MHAAPQRLRGGGRFDVTVTEGIVAKTGDVRALAREAAGLRAVAGLRVAPDLVDARRGAIHTRLIDGRPRALRRIDTADARILGASLRTLHDHRRSASGGLPGWSRRARSLLGYRRCRAEDTIAAAGPDRALAERVVACLPAMNAAPTAVPFCFLHGDLVANNILWTPRPRFVDFEFWRMGDPAEDLAYLIEVNAVPRRVADGVLEGYGVDSVIARVDAWRPLCALDAGVWYRTAAQPERAQRLLTRAAELSDLGSGRRHHRRHRACG